MEKTSKYVQHHKVIFFSIDLHYFKERRSWCHYINKSKDFQLLRIGNNTSTMGIQWYLSV